MRLEFLHGLINLRFHFPEIFPGHLEVSLVFIVNEPEDVLVFAEDDDLIHIITAQLHSHTVFINEGFLFEFLFGIIRGFGDADHKNARLQRVRHN